MVLPNGITYEIENYYFRFPFLFISVMLKVFIQSNFVSSCIHNT